MTLTTLSTVDTGTYFVNTEHAAYLIDLDNKFLTRKPFDDSSPRFPTDGHKIRFADILLIEVGYSARLVINGHMYTTSAVETIEVAA